MARKRKVSIDEEHIMPFGGPHGARKKFVGVRQRPSGRWVAEIKDTIQKIRVWLGTFDTAEEAARAYDEAACFLRGSNTRTNFWPSPQPFSTAPALPSKITSMLLRRLEARNTPQLPPPNSQLPQATVVNRNNDVEQPTVSESSNTYFTDFLSDLDVSVPLNDDVYRNMGFEPCMLADVDSCGDTNGGGEREEEGKEEEEDDDDDDDDEGVDFKFIDELGSSCNFSPFEMAQEMAFGQICDGEEEEPMTISEAMKKMKYERKFSAAIYAFHGIPECLNRKIGSGGGAKARERSKMLRVVHQVNEECNKDEKEMCLVSSLDDGIDGDLSLWSSLDLPTICYVN